MISHIVTSQAGLVGRYIVDGRSNLPHVDRPGDYILRAARPLRGALTSCLFALENCYLLSLCSSDELLAIQLASRVPTDLCKCVESLRRSVSAAHGFDSSLLQIRAGIFSPTFLARKVVPYVSSPTFYPLTARSMISLCSRILSQLN